MSSFDDWLVDPKSNRFIQTYLRGYLDISGGHIILRNNDIYVNDGDISLNGRLLVSGDASLNSKLFVADDVCMNELLLVGNDVSLNSKLFVANDVCMNKILIVGGDTSLNSKLFVANDVCMNELLLVGNDVSLNSKLFVANDVCMNELLMVGGDTSLNSKLFVNKDASFNSNVDISGDLVIHGTLGVYQQQEVKVINTTVNNYQLIVTEDISLNGNLFVSDDVSINSNLFVADDVCMNKVLFVGGDVSFNSDLFVNGDLSLNGNLDVDGNSKLKNLHVREWAVLRSTLDVSKSVVFSSTLDVSGATNIRSTLDVSGATTLASTLYVSKAVRMDDTLTVENDVSMNSNLYVTQNTYIDEKLHVKSDVSMDTIFTLGGDASLNSKLFVANDVCMNEVLMVGGDTSLNSKLFVADDVCMNQVLMVGNDVSFNSKMFVASDVCMNELLMVGGDTSLNSKLFVANDVCMNQVLMVGNDVSFNSDLFVDGDLSLNGDLSVGGDITSTNLLVHGWADLRSTLDVSKNVTLGSTLDVSSNVTINNGDITLNNGGVTLNNGGVTMNDISFGVSNLPTSITGDFESNQKIFYSEFENSERVFNGIYDISASSFKSNREPWKAFNLDNYSYWETPDGTNSSPTANTKYINENGVETDVSGEYIQIEMPFYVKIDTLHFDATGLKDFILIGIKNDEFQHIYTYYNDDGTQQGASNNQNINSSFYSNKYRLVIPKNGVVTIDYVLISQLAFSGDVIGSKISLDNGNIGIGNVNPRSALEITGDMTISNAINSENNTGGNVEHGRIMWGGIGRDISNNNHSSYIRSYFEDGTYDTSGNLAFGTSDGVGVANDKFIIHSNGTNQFITDVSMDTTLTVEGNVSLNSNLDVTGASTLNSTLDVGKVARMKSTLNVSKAATMESTLNVTGASTLSSTLEVSNAATIKSTLNVSKAASMESTLAVTGASTLNSTLVVGKVARMKSTLNVSKSATMESTLAVTGASTLNSTLEVSNAATMKSTLNVSKAATMASTLDVTGASTLNSTLVVSNAATMKSTLYVSKAVTMASTLAVTGKTTLHNDVSMNTNLNVGGTTTIGNNDDSIGLNVLNKVVIGKDLVTNEENPQLDNNDIPLDVFGTIKARGLILESGETNVETTTNIGIIEIGSSSDKKPKITTVDGTKTSIVIKTGDNVDRFIINEDGDATFNHNVSMKSVLDVDGDVSLNSKLFVSDDVSFNSKLSVGNDASFNSNLTVSGDVTIYGNLDVNKIQNTTHTTVNDYSIIVSEDISLNNDLDVSGNANVNGNANVSGNANFANKLDIQKDGDVTVLNKNLVIGGSVYLSTMVANSIFDNVGPSNNISNNFLTDNDNYTIRSSSYNYFITNSSIASAFGNNNNTWKSGIVGQSYSDNGVSIGTQPAYNTVDGNQLTYNGPVTQYYNLENNNTSLEGEYIEIEFPNYTRIDSYQLHTDTYQVPSYGVLLGYVETDETDETNSRWQFLHTYNETETNIVSPTSFSFDIDENRIITTKKVRFVINKIQTNTNKTDIPNNSSGGNVFIRYINFAGTFLDSGISVGAGYSQNTANTSMGFGTLAGNIDGKNNIALGNYTLSQTTTSDNIAIGYNSLVNNFLGEKNISIGSDTMISNKEGNHNTTLGHETGYSNQDGNNNTFIGYHSGYSNVNGNNNTFIGYNTNSNGNYSNSTAIGYNATVSADNQIVIGTSDDTIKIPGTIEIDNAFNNDVSMNSNLYVNGDVSFNSKLFVDGASTLDGTLNVAEDTTLKQKLTVNSTSIFNDVVTVNGQTNTSKIRVTGKSDLVGTLEVTGTSALKNTLNVSKSTTLSSILSVNNATTLKSTLNVTGASTFNSTLSVNGASTMKSNLNVDGNTQLNTLNTSGATQLNSLTTTGNIKITNGTINTASSGSDKLFIDSTNNTTVIRNNGIEFHNGDNTNAFIRIQDNKMSINGNQNDVVLSVTGTIESSYIRLTTGGTVETQGSATQQSQSILVGTSQNDELATRTGMLIENLSNTDDTPEGIKFTNVTNNTPDGGIVSIDASGNMDIENNLTVDGSLNVTGINSAAYIRNLTVNDVATLKNTLNVSKITTLHSTLTVDKATTLKNILNVANATTLKNTLDVSKATTLTSTLSVDKATTIKSRLDVSDNVSFNSKLTVSDTSEFKNDIDISGNVSIEYGDFTINDVSFNVTGLPTSVIPGGFGTNNQKIVYSQYSGMERVFNGIYDVSASSTDGNNNVWNVFDNVDGSYWRSNAGYTETLDTVDNISYKTVPNTYDISFEYFDTTNNTTANYLGDYIDTIFPFQIKLNSIDIRCDQVDGSSLRIEDFIIVGMIDNSWNEIKESTESDLRHNSINTLDSTIKIDDESNKFYTNRIRIAINKIGQAENEPDETENRANISKLRFNGDVLGSKIHIDNANLGIGNVNPRSALEITGNMLLSNAINGKNTSGNPVEHGRIMWGGINRDISNNNHSSYIRSYFEDGSYDTSGNLAFGTSDGVNVASDKFVINAKGVNNFITDVSMDSNLMTNGDVSFNNKLYVKNNVWVDGSLGIGTSTPVVVVDISNNGALRIPVGNDIDRPVDNNTDNEAFYGSIRYNTDNSQFEGYGPGGAWGSLGGVINVAQNTKILAAHPNADSTNNELMFFTNGDERMRIYNNGDVSINENLTVHGKINNAKIFTNAGSNSNLLVGIGNIIKEPEGSNNTGFGSNVFSSSSMTSDAMYNTAFGNLVLQNITSGNGNSGAGTSSLANTSTGDGNVAMGNGTLRDNTTGSNNTAIGKFALRNIKEGEENSAFGKQAGMDIIGDDTVKFNTFLGANTNFDVSSNKYQYSTALGYNAKITDSRQIMLGTASETVVAPGDVSMNGKLYFNSSNNSGGPNKISLWQDSVFGFGTVTNGVKYNTYDYHIFNYRGGNNSDGNLAMRLNQNNLHIEGGLHAKGDVSFNSDLSLNGNLVIGGDLSLNGNLAVVNQQNQTIINTTVNDYTVIVTEDLSLNGNLRVSGDASFNSAVTIGGASTMKSTLYVSKATTLKNTLNVDGASSLNNTLYVNQATTLNNTLTVDGNVGIGTTTPSYALDISDGIIRASYTASSIIHHYPFRTSLHTDDGWTEYETNYNNNTDDIQAPNSSRVYTRLRSQSYLISPAFDLSGYAFYTDGSSWSNHQLTNGRILLKMMGRSYSQENGSEFTKISILNADVNADVNDDLIDVIYKENGDSDSAVDFYPIVCDLKPYLTPSVYKIKIKIEIYASAQYQGDFFDFKDFSICVDDNYPWYKSSVYKQQILGGASIGKNYIRNDLNSNELLVEGNVGIGTEQPSHKLHVVGNALVTGDASMNKAVTIGGASTMKSTLYVSNATTLKNTLNVHGASSLNNTLYVNQATTLKNTLAVTGKTTLENDVSMNGAVTIGGASTLKSALYVSNATTLKNTLAVTGKTTLENDVSMNNAVTIGGASTMKSTLYVSNATTLNNTLNVNGASSLNNTLYVNQATTLKSTLNIGGKTTLTDDLSMNGNMKLDGNVDISGDLVLQGNLTVNRQNNNNIINTTINDYQIIVSEDISLNGELHVSGDVSMGNNLFVNGDASFNQIVDISGDVIIGGQKMNPQRLWTIDITEDLSSNFYPVVLEKKDFQLPIHFKITGTNSFGWQNPYNDCTLIGYHRAGGWGDKPDIWNVRQKCHVANERRFLGIYTGTRDDRNVVIYMRGGYSYEVVTDSPSVKLHSGGYYDESGYNNNGDLLSVLFPVRNSDGSAKESEIPEIVTGNNGGTAYETDRIANTAIRVDLTSGDIDQEYKSGSVGINTGTPNSNYKLDVNGDVNATSYNAASDYRIKENVVPISDTSYNIDNLRPVTYTNIKMERQDFGVIAHELQEQIPFLVTGEKDGEHHQSVNYNGLIGLLLNEVQQLKKRVQELEQSKP